MRKIIVAALMLFATQASASSALVCLFKPSGERFNLVSIEGADYIQWGTGKFEGVVSSIEDQFLIVTQYGYKGTFRMVYNVNTGQGYGGVVAFDNKELKGEILCAVQ